MVAARLVSSYLKKQDRMKALMVIGGKTPNNLKLDGKIIDVNKFTYKEDDGVLHKGVTFADIVKKAPQNLLKQEKVPFLRKLMNKFVKKKVAEKPLKVPENFSFKDKKGKKITLHAKKLNKKVKGEKK